MDQIVILDAVFYLKEYMMTNRNLSINIPVLSMLENHVPFLI